MTKGFSDSFFPFSAQCRGWGEGQLRTKSHPPSPFLRRLLLSGSVSCEQGRESPTSSQGVRAGGRAASQSHGSSMSASSRRVTAGSRDAVHVSVSLRAVSTEAPGRALLVTLSNSQKGNQCDETTHLH